MTHEPDNPATLDPEPDDLEPEASDLDLPAGDHPLEVAARRGFGPLSQLSTDIWHGQARPCVSCGQLVERGAAACDFCSQDLSEEMLDKMRQHAGPWYVLEHLRPFPGVSLERIVRQIRRGLITETSIVRGPATDYQWRFAVETPSLCRYFGRCWNCHHEVSPTETYCPSCLTHLSFQRFPEPREPESAKLPVGTPAGLHPPGGRTGGAQLSESRMSGSQAAAAQAGPFAPPAHRSSSSAELTKPLEVRPEYLPVGPAASASAAPSLAGSSAHAAHLARAARQAAAVPFEPRPAAPVASAIGIPHSSPTFTATPRAAFAAPRPVEASHAIPSRDAAGGSAIPTRPGAPAFQKLDVAAAKRTTPELTRLATAVASFEQAPGDTDPADPILPRAAWIAGAVVVIAIVTLIALASS